MTTYEVKDDGSVESVREFGNGVFVKSTIVQAYVDGSQRLHTLTLTKVKDINKGQLEGFLIYLFRPDFQTVGSYHLGDDGGFYVDNVTGEFVGYSDKYQISSDGRFINPQTHQPGAKIPPRFKCSD